MNFNSLFIKITAAIFALYGLGFIFQPHQLSIFVTDVAPTTGSAITDMRATYGGMSAAVGALLFVLASKPELSRFGLFAVLILMLGMAAGRGVGLIVDAPVNSTMYIYFALELAAATAALALLARSRK